MDFVNDDMINTKAKRKKYLSCMTEAQLNWNVVDVIANN